jgi:hypothetical protein
MYLAIITLPLLGSIATGLFERKIGFSRNIQFSILVAIALIATIIAAYLEYKYSCCINPAFTWIDSESLNIFSGFQFSALVVSPITPILKKMGIF